MAKSIAVKPTDLVHLSTEEKTNIGRSVKMAFLHQAITWPGMMGSEKTLNEVKAPGVKMTWFSDGLVLEKKGQTCIIPQANVANCVLAAE